MKSAAALLCCLLLTALIGGCATIDPQRALSAGGRACGGPKAYYPAARYNAASLRNLSWSPFGRAEQGWEIYEPRIKSEIRTRCPAETPGFAAALARWKHAHGLSLDGALDAATFEVMKTGWQARRPFVAERQRGLCPDPPAQTALATASPEESYGGKTVQLRKKALKAYRRMIAAARRANAQLRADPEALRIFSGYRSPAYDDARCALEANCNGVTRAGCSAHRTGLALDVVVGAAPGRTVDSSADDNRLVQTRTVAYRWLVANAKRYGFVNYGFEPWHWEWTGEAL